MKTRQVANKSLKKKKGSVKTRLEAKPTVMDTVFLDLRTSIEDCEKVIKAFKKLGYTTYYDAKTKVIKTTAPKTRIKEFSKLFKCIQSYGFNEVNSNRTYRIFNIVTKRWWEGEASSPEEALKKAEETREDCWIREYTDRGGWKECPGAKPQQ